MGSASLTALNNALAEVKTLAVDSAPIIYLIEANPKYEALVLNVFERIAKGEISGITSMISLTEVLVHPLRAGDETLCNRYSQLLLNSDNFATVSIDAAIASQAAALRARYQIRTPDALQLSCAIVSGCQAFLTGDRRLRKIKEISVFALDVWLEGDAG